MNRPDEIRTDLLSAYLDGELSPSEREQVEQQLQQADSAEWVDGLQSLGDDLRQLPSHQLPADFADSVFAAAATEEVAPAPATQQPQPDGQGNKTRRRVPNWAMALVSTAAILALFVFMANLQNDPPGGHSTTNTGGDPEAGHLISQDDNEPEVGSYLMAVELTLTQAGVDKKSFDRAIEKHGLKFENDILVNKELQKALLDSRFIAEKETEESTDELQLFFVVAKGAQIDDFIAFTKQRKNDFSTTMMDLAVKPEQMRAFQKLRKASQAVMAQSESRTKHRVQRLIMPASFDFTSSSFVGLGAMLPSMLEQLDEAAKANPDNLADPGKAPQNMKRGGGKEIQVEVLLILRIPKAKV